MTVVCSPNAEIDVRGLPPTLNSVVELPEIPTPTAPPLTATSIAAWPAMYI